MALGPTVRRLLGPRLAYVASRHYRSIFVDLSALADAISPWMPPNARLLDVGGGDGEALNHLLDRRPDIQVTTLDTTQVVGQYIATHFEAQVIRLPETRLEDYLQRDLPAPNVVLLSDVMHHVPPAERPTLIHCLATLLDRTPNLKIIIKDIEPGSWRASLARWTDYYITGDKGVTPIARNELVALILQHLGRMRWEESDMYTLDNPNYAIAFYR